MRRTALFALLVAVVVSGCVDVEPETPEETVETYSNNLLAFDADTEAAYNLLSSDVQNETDYSDYHENIVNMKSGLESQGVSFELLQVETIAEANESATVEAVFTMEMLQGGATNVEAEIDLLKEEDSWKINEEFNPYALE